MQRMTDFCMSVMFNRKTYTQKGRWGATLQVKKWDKVGHDDNDNNNKWVLLIRF